MSAGLHTSLGVTHTLRILAKHGILGALRGRAHWPSPAKVREAFEELGVVYAKFGQVLALRRDLLPEEYVAELEKLHERMSPVEFAVIRGTIEDALGAPLEELFATFSSEPLATATIAQVHTATLVGGAHVVVKVRRPGLQPRITEDIATLTLLAATAERAVPALRAFDFVGMVREFHKTLRREIDFRIEAQSIHRFREALADAPDVWIPDVVEDRSAEAVLTMEHAPGIRIDEFVARHPESRHRLAESIAALVLHQVFETGLFHADPHPGNVFVRPDGRLCLIDLGMVGELDEEKRASLVAILEAVVRGDAQSLTDAYLEFGLVGDDIVRGPLQTDLAALLKRIRESPVAEISVGDALASLLRVGSRHRVRNPGEILLLTRAFFIAEGVLRQLDPGLNVLEVFRQEMERVARRRYSAARLLDRTRALGRQLERLTEEAPRDIRRALRRLGDGELGRVHTPGLEDVAARASRDIERLTGAVASAALVIAGALLITASGWHHTTGEILLAVGVLGTIAVAVGAIRRRR